MLRSTNSGLHQASSNSVKKFPLSQEMQARRGRSAAAALRPRYCKACASRAHRRAIAVELLAGILCGCVILGVVWGLA
jgi:hypothetical protein